VFLPGRAEIRWQPLGVIGIVSPWNYPVQLAFAPLAGALAAGNRALLKPSELVPATSALLADAVRETFDPEHVHVVVGGPEMGEAFTRLPFDHLVFTGSTRVGKLVMRAAAENLVPVTLELGGKSPAIVLDDANLADAARSIASGKLYNAGQTCIAPDYALVPEGKLDAFVRELSTAVAGMYPTLRDNPDYTSVVNDRHRARLVGYVDEARQAGVRVVELNPKGESFDGSRKLPPTVLVEPGDDLAVMQEEIFGPLLPIRTYGSTDDAIRFVNDRPRPLALYVFGRGNAGIERVLDRTVAGGVTVNDVLLHIAQDDLPFGGVGPSGMGHYHGREGFEAFSKKKPVFHQARVNASGLLRPPYGALVRRMMQFLLGA
jgi:coniferyl-aldehyde dehydrogenase